MSIDQNIAFNWEQERQNIQKASEAVTDAKKDLIKISVSIMQSWYDCDKLKEQLIYLLEKLEVELKVYGRYLKFRANQLKNNFQKIMLPKYIMQMNLFSKLILGAAASGIIIAGGILGLQYGAVIGALSVGMRTGLKTILGISGITTIVVVGFDFFYSLWQASKNKERFQEGIKVIKKALDEVQRQKQNL